MLNAIILLFHNTSKIVCTNQLKETNISIEKYKRGTSQKGKTLIAAYISKMFDLISKQINANKN